MGGLADIQYLSIWVDFYKTLKLTELQKKKERREERTPQTPPLSFPQRNKFTLGIIPAKLNQFEFIALFMPL